MCHTCKSHMCHVYHFHRINYTCVKEVYKILTWLHDLVVGIVLKLIIQLKLRALTLYLI